MKTIIYLLILFFSIHLYAGKIEKFEENIKKNESKKSSSSNSISNSSSNSSSNKASVSSEDEEATDAILTLIGFVLEITLFGDMESSNFSHYPYYDEHGIYNKDTDEEKEFATKSTLSYIYDNELQGLDLSIKLASTYVGLRIDLSYFLEKNNSVSNDNIIFNNIMLDVYRIRESKITLWWGLGAKGVNQDYAFAIDSGIELFLIKPVSLYLNYSAGFFKGFVLQELDMAINLHINRYFIKMGYHKHFISDVELGGPTLGFGGNF